ncbi:MAG: YdgA family protein [Azoarcus sp.]|jgi:uncharacterized protein YdgA (DUF945 family)|nr:YdgA family protein [Azoarcus sp.]
MKTGTAPKIIAAIAIAAVALMGASYLAGSHIEQEFREDVAWMASHDWAVSNNVEINLVDYQRGAFTASARTDLVIQVPSQEENSATETLTVPIIHSIRHGPLLAMMSAARIHSEVQLTEEHIARITAFFTANPFVGKSPLVFDTSLGWGGGIRSRIVSPKFEAVIKEDQTKLSWGGLDAEIAADSSLKWQEMDVVLDGLSLVRNDEDFFQLGRVAFKSDIALAEGFERVFTGTTGIALDKLHFRVKGENGAVRGAVFENFRIAGEASVKDGALGTEVKLNADKFIMESDTKEVIDAFKLSLLLENIDAKAYDAILQAVQKNQARQEEEQESGEEDQEALQAVLVVFQEQAGALLRRQPAISIKDMSMRWAEGMMTGNLRIAYMGDGNPDTLSEANLFGDLQLTMPRALAIRHMTVDASKRIADTLEDGEENEVDVGKETTEEVNRELAALLEKGIFVEKGNILSADAHLRNGTLDINGKPQPFQSLFGLIPPFF